ncbi:murein biosynthesis integral membrane protein MurJ [Nocardioides speluncae]|uniref:murein biosynthesis integral membrane protein MurJ n=1 Tax=Nocardioides speluncae TaxID=2670337 RepID=UPI001F0BB2C5|nr:murein biosynthesis integral membrane protein MurJ [Nocardioides speluncae]
MTDQNSTAQQAESPDSGSEQRSILSSSAVMAAGTVVSRMSGFVRSALLVAAIGSALHAELFTIAQTVPTMLYILLAGGIFNAVLVPQLVRAMKNDPDGGEAYTNRVVTLAGLFLLTVTVALVVLAPWLMQLFLSSNYSEPELAAHQQSIIDFARLVLPQVFFYGMFVLVGQILNARGVFGPMMWAPIANNVITVAVLSIYLLSFGAATESETLAAYTEGQELLLGLGFTLGIVTQFLILVPYLKKAGFRYRPRFDFRDAGLGHTLKLGLWTVLFVIINQISYTIVVRLASEGPASSPEGTGYAVYSQTFLLTMVPHAIITVSLATAILPRLSKYAADADPSGLGNALSGTLRSALALILPFAAVLPFLAEDIAHLQWGFGAGADGYHRFVPSLALFGPGLVFFTIHYLMLRGFYSLERNRTAFWIQCVIAAVNITAALTYVRFASDEHNAPALVLAYATAYLVGCVVSYLLLRRTLGGLQTPTLVRFAARMVVAVGVATAAAAGTAWLLHTLQGDPPVVVAGLNAVLIGAVDGVVFLVMAKALGIREVTSVIDLIARRLPLRSRR